MFATNVDVSIRNKFIRVLRLTKKNRDVSRIGFDVEKPFGNQGTGDV